MNYSWPWSQHSLLGWIAEIILSMIVSIFYLSTVPTVLTFFISICEYHWAFYEIFQTHITDMNCIIEKKSFRIDDVNRSICKLISFHIDVKS